MAKKVKKAQSKVKKKTWVKIHAPKVFGGSELGESTVEDPRAVIGKHISANLMTLTRDPKKQGINVRFLVTKMHEGYAETVFNRYKLMPSSIKRMVRRNKNRLDHSFKCKTLDGVLLTIKPIVLTMNKTNKSVVQALRKKVVSFLFYHIGKKSFDQFIQDLITAKIQIALKRSLSKLYPTAICELREVLVNSYSEKPAKKKTTQAAPGTDEEPAIPDEDNQIEDSTETAEDSAETQEVSADEEKEPETSEDETEEPVKEPKPRAKKKKQAKPADDDAETDD